MADTATPKPQPKLSLTGKVVYGGATLMVPGFIIVSMNGSQWDALGQMLMTITAALLGVGLAFPEYLYKPKEAVDPNVLKSYLDWGFVASLEHEAGYSHMPESLEACVVQECIEERVTGVNVRAEEANYYAVAQEVLDNMDDWPLERVMAAAHRFLASGMATPNEVRQINALLDLAEQVIADPTPTLSPVAEVMSDPRISSVSQVMSGNMQSLNQISEAFTNYKKNPDGDPLKAFQTRRPIDQINYERVRNL